MCRIHLTMEMQEQYVRGVLRIERLVLTEQIAYGQYALDLQKLRHKHEEDCLECRNSSRMVAWEGRRWREVTEGNQL